MFGAPEYDRVNLTIYHVEVSIMKVHLNFSVVIVSEATEKYSVQFVDTYLLLESELIVTVIPFEPQSVDDFAIQPSHQYHGRKQNG